MSCPSNVTFPAKDGTRPDTDRASVLLPAPFAPSTATTDPMGTSIDTSNSAWTDA